MSGIYDFELGRYANVDHPSKMDVNLEGGDGQLLGARWCKGGLNRNSRVMSVAPARGRQCTQVINSRKEKKEDSRVLEIDDVYISDLECLAGTREDGEAGMWPADGRLYALFGPGDWVPFEAFE